MGKGKYERAKRFCVHLHALFCVGIKPPSPPMERVNDQSQSSASASSTSESSTSTSNNDYSLQRSNTLKLHSSRSVPYEFSPSLLRQIDIRNGGVQLQWPSYFAPEQTSCGLCGSPLGEAVKHTGIDGTALLITSAICFRKVEIRVKICGNTECKALHQEFPIEIGKFLPNSKKNIY